VRSLLACAVALLAAAAAAAFAGAEEYPTRPITLYVAFSPGGGADINARMVAPIAAEKLGQSIVIQNRGGAGGNLAPASFMSARPDGYALLQVTVTHAIAAGLFTHLSYDIEKSFVPVAFMGSTAYVLCVNNDVPASSVGELVALAKSGTRILSGTSGENGPTDLASKLFALSAGIRIEDIPYKGANEAVTDLLGGRVQMSFVTLPLALPLIAAHRLKGLAVSGLHRSALAPDLPTIDEAGVRGYQATTWFGILAPAGTPLPILDKLHDAFAQAIEQPALQAKMLQQGFEAQPMSRAEFAAYLKGEVERWKSIVAKSAIKPE
jgi:tripartite-type tricarboxylate transporter receptor subunit TctC